MATTISDTTAASTANTSSSTSSSSNSGKVSITGLGSGLDIDSLVEVTVEAEKAAKQAQIDRLSAKTETSISAIGTLKSAVETFEASLTSLQSISTSFDGLSGKSSNTSVASVTAGSGAVTGSYSLEVVNLASASKVASASQGGGASTKYASGGTLTIDVGDNATYNVAIKEGATLTEVRDAINERLSASAGISANIVTDSSGARLVLSSETTGAGTDLYVSGTGDLSALNVNVDEDGNHSLTKQAGSAAGYITEAGDASYKLDGLELTSSSNTVTAMSGLSIKLMEKGSSTLTVATNTDGLRESIETFVNAYNTLLTVTNALTKVSTSSDGSSTEAGALVGDASVRSLLNSVRNALVEPSKSSGGLSVLAELGITTSKTDGKLSINEEVFPKALETYASDVKAFFTGDDGLIGRMKSVTTPYTEIGGLLATRSEALLSTQKDLKEQQETLDRRIESLTTMLYTRYNNMDSLIAQLSATSDSILKTLDALNNSKD